MAKINISINDDLLARVDNTADDNFISRSGLVSLALVQYLNQADMVKAISNISKCFSTIAETNEIDEETLSTLRDYERLCRIITK